MGRRIGSLLLVLATLPVMRAPGGEQSSGPEKKVLLELYTSQG